MDFKKFVDCFAQMTCILSVEKKPGGDYGAIRIVDGNEAYIESIGLARGNRKVAGGTEFIPNSEYQNYIPRDANFEDVCYRCAVLKEPIHDFIDADRYNFGINIFLMPLDVDDEENDIAYCTFTQILIPKKDRSGLSSKISLETAQDVLTTCIKLRGADDFHAVMNEIIKDIRVSIGAEVACTMLMDENNRTCKVLCESIKEDLPIPPVKEAVDEDFYLLAETWLDAMEGSYCLLIKNEHEMAYLKEKNRAWYDSLQRAHVKTLIVFPLRSRGHFLGYIWATNFAAEDAIRIRDTLELVNYFISSEIASAQFVERLRILSAIDVLTGTLNRNEMNNRISQLSTGKGEPVKNLGVVFVDMNGLKYVNDNVGHDAGDTLLKNSSMILQSTFTDAEIFRAGGDEFLVLARDTSEEEIENKVAEIKMKSEMFEHVSFAAGCYFLEDGKNIREALKEADVRMYADKKKYYAEHPEYAR